MQVSEILELKYFDDTIPPVDDMAYYPLVKVIGRNEASAKSRQFVLHNVKLTKNDQDISTAIRQYCEIDTLKVDSTVQGLFKESKALSQ